LLGSGRKIAGKEPKLADLLVLDEVGLEQVE
jgi:hypothetical protein